MASRNISLENSVYEKLRAARQPGESFSDVVNRLLKETRPSFSLFAGLLSKGEGEELAKAFRRMKEEDREIDGL